MENLGQQVMQTEEECFPCGIICCVGKGHMA